MKLSAKQWETIAIWRKEQPLLLINEGAVRSGKTVVNNLIWARHIASFANRGVDFIITGHTVPSIARNVLQPLTEMLGIDTRLNTYNQFWMFGNRVNCFGADKIDSYKPMTGMTAFGWYGNEVTLQHPNSIQEGFNRCSGDGARILWDTNPDYPYHPIKVDHIDKDGDRLEDGRLRVRSIHWVLEDNPFLTRDYIENLKASTPSGMWYDRAIKGLWVAAEGLIYEEWEPRIHVVDPFEVPADWERIGAIDLGFDNPFVYLLGAIDHDRRLHIYAEHYKAGKLLSYHAEAIKALGKVSRIVRDHDAQEGEELRSHGISTRPAQKDVLRGIQKVAERLKIRADGKPGITISRSCMNLVREVAHYRWKEGRSKEEPVKEDDHAMDALRYLIMELDNRRVYVA